MKYLVCEISGRQHLIKPGEVLLVDKLEGESIACDKVLLSVEDNQVEIGKPYLNKKVSFEVLGDIKGPKVRVATYKQKSNYRRVIGSRAVHSQIRLIDEKKSSKKSA